MSDTIGLGLRYVSTMRQEADMCCSTCETLTGSGPWCLRCGVEMPGDDHRESRFTDDACASCVAELAGVTS